jgi:hypothetical protein
VNGTQRYVSSVLSPRAGRAVAPAPWRERRRVPQRDHRYGSKTPLRPVVVIIAARDEAGTVANVVAAARRCRLVERVVVVVNGSSDETESEARRAGAEVVWRKPAGKGEAVLAGVRYVAESSQLQESVYVLLDADLRKVEPRHIESLAAPVLSRRADMTCGILAGRFWSGDPIARMRGMGQLWTLTGQRCVRPEFLRDLKERDVRGYRIEATLNMVSASERLAVERVPLDGIVHVTREQKQTTARGVLSKLRMIVAVHLTYARLFTRQQFGRQLQS